MATPTSPHRKFPTGGEYAEALQHTHLCFQHPELKGAKPDIIKALRLPKAISGAFASVFCLTSPSSGRRYAVKCFTRHVPDQELRYEAISTQLAGLTPGTLSQQWKMGFEYLPNAIRVGAEHFPVLKMDWVEAVTLSSWLDGHHQDSTAVNLLADRFADLTADLDSHGIAHGDLQHGNLLVAADGTFRLVDYDGMFVPALSGHGGTERGHRNYQSPARGNDDFGAEVDRFSAWVIYLALKAVAADPGLWSQLHEADGEFLLLTEGDFKSPSTSPRFPVLLSHRDRTVSGLADQVRALSYQPLEALPPLSHALPTAAAGSFAATPGPTPVVPTQSSSGSLPSWMNGHLPTPPPPQTTTATTTAPPVPLPTRFTGRTFLDVLAALLLPVALVSLVLLPMAAILGPPISAAPFTVAAFLTLLRGRTRSENRALHAYVKELRLRRQQVGDPDKAAKELERDRKKLDTSETTRKAGLARDQQHLTEQHQRELAATEQDKIKEWAAIDRQLTSLDSDLQAALRKALDDEQYAFTQEQLRKCRISSAKLRNIGPKITQELAAHGIRTAADFTGYRPVRNAQYNTMGARLTLPGGRSVDVKNIGEARAQTLDAWRNQQLANIRPRRPTQLTPTRVRALTSQSQLRRDQLRSQRRKSESEANTRRTHAQQRLKDGRAHLAAQDLLADGRAQQQRQALNHRSIQLRNTRAEFDSINASLAAAGLHRRALSFGCYLRFLYTGR